jgi:hypothetical protein
MKRASTTTTRQTRSVSRRVHLEAEQKQKEEIRHQELCDRATSLMETPLLRALPLVFASGFLYKYEAQRTAAVDKDWMAIYKEIKDELPEEASSQVQIELHFDYWEVPDWVKEQGLETVLGTQEFLHQVFDKVNELKVAAKSSKKQQEKARAALPKWGIDFHAASLFVWGPCKWNEGGIGIDLLRDCSSSYGKFPNVFIKWQIRLDPGLILWTGIRAWRVYDFEPLWP